MSIDQAAMGLRPTHVTCGKGHTGIKMGNTPYAVNGLRPRVTGLHCRKTMRGKN